jgi:hypothetical protein
MRKKTTVKVRLIESIKDEYNNFFSNSNKNRKIEDDGEKDDIKESYPKKLVYYQVSEFLEILKHEVEEGGKITVFFFFNYY